MPRLKDAITGLVERLSGPYKGMPYLRYFKTEAEKKAYLDFYNKAKSGTADAPRSRRVSEGVYAEVQRSRGPDVGTTYNRFFKTEAERDVFLKRIQERAANTVQSQGTKATAKEVAEAAQGKPLTSAPTVEKEFIDISKPPQVQVYEFTDVITGKITLEQWNKQVRDSIALERKAARPPRRSKANAKK